MKNKAIDPCCIGMNNAAMTKPALKKRITRDQWLRKGLEIFAVRGSDGLRVEKIASELEVSKSGFYSHFQDRDDFLNHLLDYWVHEFTEVITENTMMQHLPARERLLLMMTVSYEQELGEFDAAIDMWARTNKLVASKRKQVINKRLKFVHKAFEELGFKGDDLEMRARVLVGFQMGERQIFDFNKKTTKLHRELRLKMLIGETD